MFPRWKKCLNNCHREVRCRKENEDNRSLFVSKEITIPASCFTNNADSKTRLEALILLSEGTAASNILDGAFSSTCKLVAVCVADNNQKASAAACNAISKIAEFADVSYAGTSVF